MTNSENAIDRFNLKVVIVDPDFYALNSLNSYLAWDRRTRVVKLLQSLNALTDFLKHVAAAEAPDVILIDADIFSDGIELGAALMHMRQLISTVKVICLGHNADPMRAAAALNAGGRGYLVRNEVRHLIASAVCFAVEHSFVVTQSIHAAVEKPFDMRLFNANVLPSERHFPEMTERIRQALWLCVVEGMSAQLAADEMGVSPHTVRSYIKEGYRILEAHDDRTFPDEMGPIERAFMRFTALGDENNP